VSVRARLLLLVGLVSLPLLALVVSVTIDGGRRATEQARSGMERLARVVANEEGEVIDRARHLMVALAELPVVREHRSAECSALFARLMTEYKIYTTLGVTSATGDIVCSAPAAQAGATLADRPIFQSVRAGQGFTVGEYTIGRLSGKPSLGLGYPVKDAAGELRGMLFGAIDLAWLPGLLGEIGLPPGTTVTLVDRNGIVFARLPEAGPWIGTSVRSSPIARAPGGDGMTTATLEDLDGRRRLFARAPLRYAPDSLVAVGIDRSLVLGTMYRDLLQFGGLVVFLAALALVATWFGATTLILRPLRRVIQATRRLAAGDLGSRVGDAGGPGELGELGRAFDDMAETVARRTRQVELAEQRYRGLFERNLAGIFRTRDGRLIECNLAYARVFGYASPVEVMEAPLVERYADPADRVRLIEDLAGRGSVTRELLGRRKDGSHIWVLVQIMETRHETATFREGMVIDITDRRRQEQLAQEAVALREVAALAAAAAHEINNPLAVVQGQIELVSDTIPDRWRVEQIRDAVRRIAEIIARMTRITRLEKSVFSPGLSPMLDIRRSSDTKDGDERA
jgi:PAS domain S-box-containing protein